MTGHEEETFPQPVGIVNEFYALNSELATFPSSFNNKGLKVCDFKVSFPENFIRDIQFLIELGFASPENLPLIQKITNRFMPKGKIRDLEYVRVRMKGTRKGKRISLTIDAFTKSRPGWHAPAGAYDTGVPPSIIAQMIVKGKISKKGVFPAELCIDPLAFFKELKKRNIEVL